MKLINLLPKKPKSWVLLRKYQGRIVWLTSICLSIFIALTVCIFGVDLIFIAPREKRLQLALNDTKNAISVLSPRQAIFLAVKNKASAVSALYDARIPYDSILDDLLGRFSPGVRLKNLTLDRTGQLIFSIQAKDASVVQTLITSILAKNFSPVYTYTLKSSSRAADGTYLLEFYFSRKS